MLERTISRKVVEWLYGHEIIERSESNIYVYAYELLISSTISIFLILIASCVCGNIWYSLAFLQYWDSGYPKIWKLPILKKMASTLNTVDDMQCDSMGYNTWIDRDYSCDIIDEHLME